MNRCVLSAVAMAALASGCQPAPPVIGPGPFPERPQETLQAGSPYTLSPAEIAAVKRGVKGQLKDPTSPLFGEFRSAKNSDDVVTVCGWVNAKNSYGGYTGDKPFIGVIVGSQGTLGFVPAGFGGTDTATYVVRKTCAKAGVVI